MRDLPCTAEELIEALKALQPDTRIMTKGYEGGYQDAAKSLTIVRVALNVNDSLYYGPHDDADDGDEKAVNAVIL